MKVPANWTFKDASVANSFDSHVREQLPWYDLATGAVAHVARHYISQGGLIYDIGASTGNISRSIEQTAKARNARIISIEASAEMCAIFNGYGTLVQEDALDFEYEEFDVAICFLTLMFLPIIARRDFIRRLHALIRPGGALIVFDKTEIGIGYLSTVMHRLTIAGKVATGCDPKEIIDKELSLSGIQRPLTYQFMRTALPNAVEIFRFGEFAGYVIEGDR